MIPYTADAKTLFLEGQESLARVEANGMAVDTLYLQNTLRKIKQKVARMEADLEGYEVMKVWRRTFGHKANIDSPTQLSRVLFNEMGYTPTATTKGGNKKEREQYSTDEDSLWLVGDPFVEKYLRAKKLKKLGSTYIKGILRETVDGRIHPFFSLNNARSYRSAAEDPNVQNIEKHDPYVAPLLRRAFIPSPGNVLVEVDFSQAEVRVAACVTKDRNLIRYVNDPKSDMHRDMACKLFMLSEEQVKASKPVRQLAKGSFVFASFYGDWYVGTSRRLWQNAKILDVRLGDGTTLFDHLKSKGINELGELESKQAPRPGSFEGVVKDCDNYLWKKMFPEYAQWKLDSYQAYCERGYLESVTGFIYRGYLNRKEVGNYPVQGPAFHCLLWALNRIVLKKLPKLKMKAKVTNEVHDSMLGDVPVSEVDDFIHLCRENMTTLLRKHYQWLVVPMQIEAEVGENWADKTAYEFKD